jgi:ribonuclease HI
MRVTVFTDGGSRGNPGLAAGAFFIYNETQDVLHKEGKFLGIKTNNEAEYEAFLASITWLKDNLSPHQIDEVVWKLDSKLVVEQLNRKWKIKDARMLALAQQIWQILAGMSVRHVILHIPREQNSAADGLVNLTLDTQTTQ